MARHRVTVDTGGTFSDFVYLNEETGALSIAKRIGWPVVVKPLDASHGRGIATNIRNEEELRVAFDRVDYWAGQGAQLSPTVARLVAQAKAAA